MHVNHNVADQLRFTRECYLKVTNAFLQEEYRPLRQATHEIETARKQLKRARRREIIGFRKVDPIVAAEKNTWYWVANSNMEQMLYCLKRINDPCREHVGNNFTPVASEITFDYLDIQQQITDIFQQAELVTSSSQTDEVHTNYLRKKAEQLQKTLSYYRTRTIDSIQQQNVNIESTTVFLNIIQESQQMLSCLRHTLRGIQKLNAFDRIG